MQANFIKCAVYVQYILKNVNAQYGYRHATQTDGPAIGTDMGVASAILSD